MLKLHKDLPKAKPPHGFGAQYLVRPGHLSLCPTLGHSPAWA
jgi:hypothetical protein